jgi:hypothetical protein
MYCTYDRRKIGAWRARGARARVSVNFRKFSPCIARARRARAGLAFYPQAPDSAMFHRYPQIVYTAVLNLVLDLDLVLNLVLDKFSTKFRLGCLLSSGSI